MILNIIPVLLALSLATAPPGPGEDARRLVSLLDYMAADYGGAVSGGKVLSSGEYEEMSDFAQSAENLAEDIQAPALARETLKRLSAAVGAKADPHAVSGLAEEAKALVLAAFSVSQEPARAPSRPKAEALFKENCRLCHGDTGLADTPTAARLEPRPRNFQDPKAMAGMNPFRAFNAISLGVPKTAMPAWEKITPEDRWSLAAYVFTLRFKQEEEEFGKRLWEQTPSRPQADFRTLASLREDRLFSDQAWRGRDFRETDRKAIIAFLRGSLAFHGGADPLDVAADLVARALEAARRADAPLARNLALDAYLQGFEPVENALSSRDAALVRKTEAKFQEFRGLLSGPLPPVEKAASELLGIFQESREVLQSSRGISPRLAFAGSFAVLLREGLEAVLVIATILALLGVAGVPQARRYVHAGWAGALAAGVLTWVAAQTLIRVSGLGRELLEGLTALLASLILVYVSWWLHSRSHVQGWKAFIEKTVAGSLTTRRLMMLAGVSFLAVYREAFETILFYQALLLENPGARSSVGLGALAGAAVLGLCSILIIRLQMRLPLRLFFGATSGLLYALAVVLAGKGIKELQEAGWASVTPFPFPQIEFLGIHPTLEGLALQGLLLTLLFIGLSWTSWIEPVVRWTRLRREVHHIRADLGQAQADLAHVREHAENLIRSVRGRSPSAELKEMDGHLHGLDGDLSMLQGHMKDLNKDLEEYFESPLGTPVHPGQAPTKPQGE